MWNNFWVIQTNIWMVWASNTIMVVILWLGNLKWNLKKTFCSKCQNCWEEKNLQPSWNLYTKYLLKYSILGNWVIKWLLIFVFDTAMIQIFGMDGLPKTYFRKVEFNCKVQLSRWPLLDVPFALRVPMCDLHVPMSFLTQIWNSCFWYWEC